MRNSILNYSPVVNQRATQYLNKSLESKIFLFDFSVITVFAIEVRNENALGVGVRTISFGFLD